MEGCVVTPSVADRCGAGGRLLLVYGGGGVDSFDTIASACFETDE